ncbi:hypothetical protein DPEC_G00268910 [Dallia pectoralis]|uniref:Uncharacterized protein n=1 Tax=Dallia pectoralis TaxID=75939 RepID=A0ACC2FNX7_DALPE|nr:hypothetical protein DPEC_G00268910 [Dallia pectoralis]
MKGSELVAPDPGHLAYVETDTSWEPMEAKAGPLEVMTLPTNSESYSGEGRDQDPDHSSPTVVQDREDAAMAVDGSGGGGSDFPGGFGSNVNTSPGSDASFSLKPPPSTENPFQTQTVVEYTSVSQWQLVDRPTTTFAAVVASSQGSGGTAEEARGEIVYVRRPTEKLFPITSSKHFSSFPSVVRKQSVNLAMGTERPLSLNETTTHGFTSRPTAHMEPLTTTTTSTEDTRGTDPGEPTEEPPISIAWLHVEEETTSATHVAVDEPKTTTVLFAPTATDSFLNVTDRQAEAASVVSRSFVAGHGWKPSGGEEQASEEGRTSVTTANTEAPSFGVAVPTWVYGINPSGVRIPKRTKYRWNEQASEEVNVNAEYSVSDPNSKEGDIPNLSNEEDDDIHNPNSMEDNVPDPSSEEEDVTDPSSEEGDALGMLGRNLKK